MERLIILGIFLILIGMIVIMISTITSISSENSSFEVGAGGFIGPIPFGFFTSKKAFWMWLALFILAGILWFLSKRFL